MDQLFGNPKIYSHEQYCKSRVAGLNNPGLTCKLKLVTKKFELRYKI